MKPKDSGTVTEITSIPTPQATEQTPFRPQETETQPKTDRWHVSFRTHLQVCTLLILGIAFALTHHFYYASLDGHPVTETPQEWAIRIGTGLAVLAKACLAASAAMSYQQHYWRVLRTRPISIRGIDGIMGLLSNPANFFSWEVLRNSWTSAAIALLIWCMPLSTIIPPASLTANLSVFQHNSTSPVPHINWTDVLYMTTGGGNGFADAGQPTYRVVTGSAYSGSILPMPALHSNYTYTLEFMGPRLRCGDVKNSILFDEAKLNSSAGSFGSVSYNATNPFMKPEQKSAYEATYFPAENIYDIWFFTPTRNFSCEGWNTTYTATFSFINGEQSIDVSDIRYENRMVDMEEVDETLKFDKCPGDRCAYKGWFKAIAGMLTGDMYSAGPSGTIFTKTRIMQTALTGCPEMSSAAAAARIVVGGCPGPSLEGAVELLSQNATLSFFGALPSVYWPDPSFKDSQGTAKFNVTRDITTTPANLTISTTRLIHSYTARSLLLSYAAAILATVMIMLAGFHALWTNGIAHSSSFSGIVCTTRNQDLDKWAQGHCLGSEPLDKTSARQKLQYGLLAFDNSSREDAADVRHAAFGFPGSIVRLRKGDTSLQ